MRLRCAAKEKNKQTTNPLIRETLRIQHYTNMKNFSEINHALAAKKKKSQKLYRTSDLPADVRTPQQVDHDAWEEAIRNGEIPTWHN